MAPELDPFIARLVGTPEWLPTWSGDAWAAIADAGEPAHRRALDRWNAVREQGDAAAYGAIAVLLAECFDDDRGLLAFAESVDRETLLEAVLPFTPIMTPGGHCARSVERLILTRMVDEVSRGTMRSELTDAVAHLRIDDHGEVYLPMRRTLVTELSGTPEAHAAERYADRLLVAAATATPNQPDVVQTVLSYWGADEPLDNVPTAEPLGDEAPASWMATCAVIGGTRRTDTAEQLIELAHETDFWRSSGTADAATHDARAYVEGLALSPADIAEDCLLEVAKADVSVSGQAVSAIARRRARIAGVPPITRPRLDAVTQALVDTKCIDAPPGPRGDKLASDVATTADSPLDLAALVLGAAGRAIRFDLAAGAHPMAGHVRRSLAAVALAAGHRRLPYAVDESHGEVEVTNTETYVRTSFRGGRIGAAEFDALVPDGQDDAGRALQRIRIDAVHVTYAMVDPAAWSTYLDWAASTSLPDPSPVPPRRSAQPRGELGGFLGRLFGRG